MLEKCNGIIPWITGESIESIQQFNLFIASALDKLANTN